MERLCVIDYKLISFRTNLLEHKPELLQPTSNSLRHYPGCHLHAGFLKGATKKDTHYGNITVKGSFKNTRLNKLHSIDKRPD